MQAPGAQAIAIFAAILFAVIGEHDLRTLAREQFDHGLANAAGSPGDDYFFGFEAHVYKNRRGLSAARL